MDENGNPTDIPYDNAGYMDIAPDDKGENVRREICLSLEQMGILPEASHHEEGPGQNEIDFKYSEALSAADNAMAFVTVVKAIAARNGLWADFSPKPIKNKPGNGMHINMSVISDDGSKPLDKAIAGILDKAEDITVFMNPCEQSYQRLGCFKAPSYISWSSENRSQLIRIPASSANNKRAELRSPDPTANPYLAFALIIYAGLYGIKNNLELPEAADINLYSAPAEVLKSYKRLPSSLKEASLIATSSKFIADCLPEMLIKEYCK